MGSNLTELNFNLPPAIDISSLLDDTLIHSSNALDPSYTVDILARDNRYLENLKILRLGGGHNMDYWQFVKILMYLSKNSLKELSLDSVTFKGQLVSWWDFFQIVGFKSMWVDDDPNWIGASKHYHLQQRIFDDIYMSEDDFFDFEDQRDREGLWKGLKVERCQLKGLFDLDYQYRQRMPTPSSVSPHELLPESELRLFEKWMVNGLDEDAYDMPY